MLPESGTTSNIPVLGICFGAQILAESYMTGSVSFLRESEIGPRTINIDIPDHPLFRGTGNILKVYEFHYNKICCEGLIPVSSSAYRETSFLQAFQVPGTLCFGVQFHPEFDGNQLKNLTDHYGRLLSHLGWDNFSFNDEEKVLKPHYDILDNFMKIKRSIFPEGKRPSNLEPIH
jgi:GMP synthase-like glutamine amidotransferase